MWTSSCRYSWNNVRFIDNINNTLSLIYTGIMHFSNILSNEEIDFLFPNNEVKFGYEHNCKIIQDFSILTVQFWVIFKCVLG